MQTYKLIFTVNICMDDPGLLDYIRVRLRNLEVNDPKTGEWAKPDRWQLTGGKLIEL